nr:hypothetical protein [uncultured Duganella sp.]
MKKYLYAGILTACLAAPAFAANTKFAVNSPEEPLHRRAILLCVVVVLALHALRHAPPLPKSRPYRQDQ